MAGHSAYKNIMHRKGRQDAAKAKMFAKFAREITVAAKLGQPDPDMNPRLRLAIQVARAQSMPKDNIERAIRKAAGGDMETYEQIRYEGYGPGGVAVIVDALTDNRNRTASEVRSIFSKHGGNLGESGSVAFQFNRCGAIIYPASVAKDDAMFEAALEAGAEDVVSGGDGHEIITAPDDFGQVAEALKDKFGDPQSAGLTWKPSVTVDVDEEKARTLLSMLEALEDNDDVRSVSSNMDISDELMEKLSA